MFLIYYCLCIFIISCAFFAFLFLCFFLLRCLVASICFHWLLWFCASLLLSSPFQYWCSVRTSTSHYVSLIFIHSQPIICRLDLSSVITFHRPYHRSKQPTHSVWANALFFNAHTRSLYCLVLSLVLPTHPPCFFIAPRGVFIVLQCPFYFHTSPTVHIFVNFHFCSLSKS